MNCYYHPENESVGVCTSCGKLLCSECVVEVQGKQVCRDCLSHGTAAMGDSDKDPNTAFLIELVGGFFGLLGLGYFYVERPNDGIIRLIAWLLYTIVAWIAVGTLTVFVIGVCCWPLQIVIQIAVPIWSAMTLKKSLEQS